MILLDHETVNYVTELIGASWYLMTDDRHSPLPKRTGHAKSARASGPHKDAEIEKYNEITLSGLNKDETAEVHDIVLQWVVYRRRLARVLRWFRRTLGTIIVAVLTSWLVTGAIPVGIEKMFVSMIARIHGWTEP